MKKRILSLALALAMCASLIPAASAASLSTESKNYTLTNGYIDSDLGKVTVDVKLDGYIGELDMKAVGIENELENGLGYTPDTASPSTSRPVYVVKAGSNVTFSINNSKGAYNFCYDNGVAPDEYGSIYVDAGGGAFYDGTSPELYPITMSPSRLSSGKVALNAAGIISVDTKKVNSNTYSYSAEDGLYTFAFTATDKVSGDEWWMADIVARYVIGTFLFISEEQVDQLKSSGTMTFHKGLVCEYDCVYPGLAELLGVEIPKQQDLALWFEGDDTAFPSDYGPVYRYTLTNNTAEPIKGYYAIVTYYDGKSGLKAQVHSIDIDLQPGQTTEQNLTSNFYHISKMDVIKITFESKAERDAFFRDPALSQVDSGYGPLYVARESMVDDWFTKNFES